ncbi:MAG: hypothetical protein FJ387_15355 [Verrucomicrobia bacterium]|nr:hypothetical protein [Verrucomicrobiota bacterium]
MIQNALQRIGGIEAYGLVSMGLFMLAFLVVVVRAARLKKAHLDTLAALPLDDRPNSNEGDCA